MMTIHSFLQIERPIGLILGIGQTWRRIHQLWLWMECGFGICDTKQRLTFRSLDSHNLPQSHRDPTCRHPSVLLHQGWICEADLEAENKMKKKSLLRKKGNEVTSGEEKKRKFYCACRMVWHSSVTPSWGLVFGFWGCLLWPLLVFLSCTHPTCLVLVAGRFVAHPLDDG
jgi:hypothetical protein